MRFGIKVKIKSFVVPRRLWFAGGRMSDTEPLISERHHAAAERQNKLDRWRGLSQFVRIVARLDRRIANANSAIPPPRDASRFDLGEHPSQSLPIPIARLIGWRFWLRASQPPWMGNLAKVR